MALAQPAAPAPRLDHGRQVIDRLRAATHEPTVVEALRRQWPYLVRSGQRLAGCRVARVHPRGDSAFVIDYRLRLRADDGEGDVSVFGELALEDAVTRALTARRRLAKPKRGQLAVGDPAGLIAPIPDLGLVLRPPGLDERLRGLRLLHDPRSAVPILARKLDLAEGEVSGVEVDLLGHRLGKRSTLRLGLGASKGGAASFSIIVKMYKARSGRGHGVADALSELRSLGFGDDSAIRVPKPVAFLADLQVLLMEDVLEDPAASPITVDPVLDARAAGRALAELHRCPLKVAARHGPAQEIALLERWVELMADCEVAESWAFSRALDSVRADLTRHQDAGSVLIHRDFHEKQVIVGGGNTYLIDFDTLARGDPALDLGNYLAHLDLAELQGRCAARRLSDAFLDGYGGPPSLRLAERIEAYRRATLLRLACIYSFSTRWRGLAAPLLDVCS